MQIYDEDQIIILWPLPDPIQLGYKFSDLCNSNPKPRRPQQEETEVRGKPDKKRTRAGIERDLSPPQKKPRSKLEKEEEEEEEEKEEINSIALKPSVVCIFLFIIVSYLTNILSYLNVQLNYNRLKRVNMSGCLACVSPLLDMIKLIYWRKRS